MDDRHNASPSDPPNPIGGATPPDGGRQTHDAMRAAQMRPVSGPAGDDRLAAGGGLEVPGREPQPVDIGGDLASTRMQAERIPGEHDEPTLMHPQPGALNPGFGARNAASSETTLTDADRRDRIGEGGGADGVRADTQHHKRG